MKFKYQARTEEGEVQEGTIEASSRQAALKILETHNLSATSLNEVGLIPVWLKEIKFLKQVSQKEVVLFSRQLSMMFDANVPLVESLETLAMQLKNPIFKEKILEISKTVEGGVSLSNALARHQDIFSSFYISMVKSGEASGKLAEVLRYLADRLEAQYEFMAKIRGAMIYPALVVTVSFGVIGLIIYFVMPEFTAIFTSEAYDLPLFTKIVIAISEFLRKWLIIILIMTITALVAIFLYLRKTKEGQEFLDRKLLDLPVLGSFLKMFYLSRFSQNLATLIAGGLPIAQALRICSDVVNNIVYKDIILKTQEGVKKGKTISSILITYPNYFPPVFTQMVATGEKAGQMEETLNKIAIFFQKEVERALEVILSVIEPALIIFLALIVGIIAASVFIPMYNFIGSLG